MIRGTKREIATIPTKQFDVGTSIHNRFDIEVVDAVSGEIKHKAYAENVICDQLWTRLLSGNAYNVAIHYGEGAGTPSASDTSLFAYLGGINSSVYKTDFDYGNNVYVATKKVVIGETVAVGKIITEVGIAYSGSKTSLVTHAMLKDMNGNPVSLSKTDADIFNIYATVYVHLSIPTGVRALGTHRGPQYAYEATDFYRDSAYYPGYLAHIAGLCSKPHTPYLYPAAGGCPYLEPLGGSITYDSTHRSMKVTCTRAGATAWNKYRGLKTLFLGQNVHSNNSATHCIEFAFEIDTENAWYPKTEIRDETLGTGDGSTCDFSTKMNFAVNATVKVDSVPVEASVDCCCTGSIGHYLRLLRLPASGATINSLQWYNRLPLQAINDTSFYLRYNAADGLNLKPVYENVLYETHGISAVSGGYVAIAVSNDLVDWITLEGGTVPEEYQHYRYWSLWFTRQNDVNYVTEFTTNKPLPTSNNVHIAEAPPEGAVVTIDYDAICIAKDENHVFDFSVTFKFNEYTE